MLSVPFCAVPLPSPFPLHLTVSSCLRQRVFYIFFCAPRRQGYKNCLVLKAFYATLCAQSTAAATAAAASACLARCCYGAASLPLSLSLSAHCSFSHLTQSPLYFSLSFFFASACASPSPHQHLRLYLIFLLAHASHTLFVLSTSLPLPASSSSSLSLCFSACILLLLFFALFSVLLASFFGKIQLLLFCFLLCVFAFCVRTYVCVCLTLSIFYDYFSFLCVTFYIFFIAPFFVLFCLSRLTLVALSAAFSMPACGSPPSPHIFTFVFSVFHSSRCLSIEFAVSLTLSVCVCFLFFALLFICISYFKHFSCTRISQKSRFTFTFYVALLFALRRVVTHMSALPLLHSFIRFHFVIHMYVCVAAFAGRFQSKIAFFPFYV